MADHTDGMIVREFSAELTPGQGRTVDVRIVPYGERITHDDGHGGVPLGVPYQEEWLPGVFSHQINAANRVYANFEHEPGVGGVVGHGLALREASDGFHGSFVIHETPAGETTLTLLKAGALDGVSLEAKPVKNITDRGIVKRAKANLRAIALTRYAAYAGARVLALREEPEITIDQELLPTELDPDLVERCRRLGLKLPQRYEAHPATTDTPDLSGTSGDGTRQTVPTELRRNDEPNTERA